MSATPGPWIAKEIALCGGETTWQVVSADGADIPITRENTLVAAAAPDLLAALAFAASCIKCGEPWTPTCERIIDGAIAKANGREVRHE